MYCEPEVAACQRARADLVAIAGRGAPLPAYPIAQSLWASWLDVVFDEPCTPGPVAMPAPHFPPVALRQGQQGVVKVGLVVNRCGDVRRAWIVDPVSRKIDRATLSTVRGWRVGLPAGTARGAVVNVPITFALD